MTRSKPSDRAAYLLELCRGKRVLHIGCADEPFTEQKLSDGRLLHQLICEVAARCCGVDTSAVAIEILKNRGFDDVMAGTVEELLREGAIKPGDFDIVLAAEVVEHIADAGAFLRSLRPLLSEPEARLIVTTPNSYCAYRWVYTMVTGREGGHPEHLAQYSRNTLGLLLKLSGYETESVRFYSGEEYIKNEGRDRVFRWIDRIAFRWRPELGDGLIVCCKTDSANQNQ